MKFFSTGGRVELEIEFDAPLTSDVGWCVYSEERTHQNNCTYVIASRRQCSSGNTVTLEAEGFLFGLFDTNIDATVEVFAKSDQLSCETYSVIVRSK